MCECAALAAYAALTDAHPRERRVFPSNPLLFKLHHFLPLPRVSCNLSLPPVAPPSRWPFSCARHTLTHPRALTLLAAVTDTSIGDFQIILWTGVLLVAVVLGAVYALVDMGSAPLDAGIRTISAEKKGMMMGGGGGSKQKQ